MTLTERIAAVDSFQARKFERLVSPVRVLAAEGITRFLDACDRHGVEPDSCTIREIIDDAERGRQIWKETSGKLSTTTTARTPVGAGAAE